MRNKSILKLVQPPWLRVCACVGFCACGVDLRLLKWRLAGWNSSYLHSSLHHLTTKKVGCTGPLFLHFVGLISNRSDGWEKRNLYFRSRIQSIALSLSSMGKLRGNFCLLMEDFRVLSKFNCGCTPKGAIEPHGVSRSQSHLTTQTILHAFEPDRILGLNEIMAPISSCGCLSLGHVQGPVSWVLMFPQSTSGTQQEENPAYRPAAKWGI